MRLGQGTAAGDSRVVLLAVILRQRFQVNRLIGLFALGRNRLVQRRHRRRIIPCPQRRLPGLQIGIHLGFRRLAMEAEHEDGENEREHTCFFHGINQWDARETAAVLRGNTARLSRSHGELAIN